MNCTLHDYDRYIVCFSGGKDSTATFLYLLEHGIPRSRIELWHQDIDGCEDNLFDWPVTRDYCRRFAAAFGVPLYLQWKIGGFRQELLRTNARTAPVRFECPDGSCGCCGGVRDSRGTRLRFPQLSASLTTRWCSAYLKINVCAAAITHQERFLNSRTLVLSGERGEESTQRARYAVWEPDRSDLRQGIHNCRHVDRHRPIRDWTERQVWALIEKYRIRAHPCYYMGWPRCSCLFCIFGSADQFSSAARIAPAAMQKLIALEERFGYTMKRKQSLRDLLATGNPYAAMTGQLCRIAGQTHYDLPILLPDHETWALPAGAKI